MTINVKYQLTMEQNSEEIAIFVPLFGNRRRHRGELSSFDPSENLQPLSARAISLKAVPPVVYFYRCELIFILTRTGMQSLQTKSDKEVHTLLKKIVDD